MIHIREEVMGGGHLTKFHLDGLPFTAVVHRFSEPDFYDPHDHPWCFRTTILHGGYVEEVYDAEKGFVGPVEHYPGETFVVDAGHIHRVVDLPLGECWTLIQPMPHLGTRKSGFYKFEDGKAFHRFWDEPEFQSV